MPKIEKPIEKLTNSQDAMAQITSFLPMNYLLHLNLVNRKFYNESVPRIMNSRFLYPSCNMELHLFVKNSVLYALQLSNGTPMRIINFEEDEWRHDSQYQLTNKQVNRVQKMFDFKKLWEDEKYKNAHIMEKDCDILPQYIVQISKFQYLVFPLKNAMIL